MKGTQAENRRVMIKTGGEGGWHVTLPVKRAPLVLLRKPGEIDAGLRWVVQLLPVPCVRDSHDSFLALHAMHMTLVEKGR